MGFFFIFRLLFITGSSLSSVDTDFNQRQSSGIIFYADNEQCNKQYNYMYNKTQTEL